MKNLIVGTFAALLLLSIVHIEYSLLQEQHQRQAQDLNRFATTIQLSSQRQPTPTPTPSQGGLNVTQRTGRIPSKNLIDKLLDAVGLPNG